MAGAYTALPPEDSTPDVPEGWNPEWTFPGPPPPGYEFDYGFNIEAQGFVIPGGATSGTVALTDHEDYVTSIPDESASVTLSAKFTDTDEAVEIYGTSVYAYSAIGDGYSGVDFNFLLNVTALDNGRTVQIIAESTPFSGYDVDGTTELIVVVSTEDNFRAVIEATWAANAPPEGAGNNVTVNVRYGYPYQYAYFSCGDTYSYPPSGEIVSKPGIAITGGDDYYSGSATIEITRFQYFRVMYSLFPFMMAGSLALTLKIYVDDELFSTHEFSTSEWKENGSVWGVDPSELSVYSYY